MKQPMISVVMPVYNNREYIRQAIDSVFAQNVPLELLVIDDASTDGTEEVLADYKERADFRYLRNEKNVGAAASRNRGNPQRISHQTSCR